MFSLEPLWDSYWAAPGAGLLVVGVSVTGYTDKESNLKIECQQQNIMKIRDGIPGHGQQEVRRKHHPIFSGSIRVLLACGCSLPIPWLSGVEQQTVQHLPLKTRG